MVADLTSHLLASSMAIQRRPARSRAGGLLLSLLGAALVLGVLAISKWEGVWASRRVGAQLQVRLHADGTATAALCPPAIMLVLRCLLFVPCRRTAQTSQEDLAAAQVAVLVRPAMATAAAPASDKSSRCRSGGACL